MSLIFYSVVQRSKPLDYSDSQQGPVTLNNGSIQDNNSDVGEEEVVKDISHYFPDEAAHRELVLYEELLTTGAVVSSVGNTIPSSIIVSSPSSCEVKKDFVMMESSFEEPSNVIQLSSQESLGVILKSADILCIPPKQTHKTEQDSAFPKLMVESELIVAAKTKVAGGNVIEEKNDGFIKECDVSSYNFTPMKYTNNGLHSFYETNHYAMENLSCTNRMPALSSLGNNGFSSSAGTSILHTERFSAEDFLLAAEKFEGTFPNGKSGSYPLNGRRDFWKKGTSFNDKEKSMLTKDDLKTLFPVSHLKKQGSTLDYPAQQLRAYHRLLKEGR